MFERKGFVSVVAIGIFAVLALFGLLIQRIVMDTRDTLLSNRDEIKAELLADSIFEFLEMEARDHDYGYNSPEYKCAFNVPGAVCDLENPDFVDMLSDIVGSDEVEMSFQLKGRSEDILNSEVFSDMYSVPAPGQGDAGFNCHRYEPSLLGDEIVRTDVDDSLTQLAENIDQMDYSCNWNKLVLGSDSTDRVMIPLYYEGENGEIVQPFFGQEGRRENFILRMRTPCDCSVGGAGCSPIDPTVCTDDARFDLEGNPDDVIAQWQISSHACELGQECEVLTPSELLRVTSNFIGNINDNLIFNSEDRRIIFFSFLENEEVLGVFFHNIEYPYLTLQLTSENINAPYMEYQLLSSRKITSNIVESSVRLNIGDNTILFSDLSQIYADNIDFALQN